MLKRLITVCLIFSSSFTFGQSAASKYVEQYKEAAIRLMDEHGIPASVVLGIAIHESASGTSKIARYLNNHFGMKGHNSSKQIHSAYKGYENVDDSYEDFVSRMKNRNSLSPLFGKLDSYDYKKWALEIQRGGYAHSRTWASQVMGIIKAYKLYEYDKKPAEQAQLVELIEPESTVETLEAEVYSVKKGDNLNLIAKKFKTSVTTIKQTNRLKTNRLSPGQRLKI